LINDLQLGICLVEYFSVRLLISNFLGSQYLLYSGIDMYTTANSHNKVIRNNL